MNNFDVSKIINGTDKKALENNFNALKKSYSEENAKSYCECYQEKPLSFILENSRYIFGEPAYGLPFYEHIINNCEMPFFCFENECEKIKDFLSEFGTQMNPEQRTRFQALENTLETKMETYQTEIMLESFLLSKGEDEKAINDYYDSLYLYKKGPDDEKGKSIMLVNKSINGLSPLSKILHVSKSANDIGYRLLDTVKDAYDANVSDLRSFASNMESVLFMNRLAHSNTFTESMKLITNANTYLEMTKLSGMDVGEILVHESTLLKSNQIPSSLSGSSAVNAIFEASAMDTFTKEIEDEEIFGFLQKKHAAYESCLELIQEEYNTCKNTDDVLHETSLFTYVKETSGYTGPMTIEDGYHLMIEAVATVEMYMREYENNGAPNKVIQKATSGLRDNVQKPQNSNIDDDGDVP